MPRARIILSQQASVGYKIARLPEWVADFGTDESNSRKKWRREIPSVVVAH